MNTPFVALLSCLLSLLTPLYVAADGADDREKQIAYLVSDLRIPFWEIMSRGVRSEVEAQGYSLTVYSADNSSKRELEHTIRALKGQVSGIVVSPTSSSACVTILGLAKKEGVPVVISDIGTEGGEYLSYISSDNRDGAYQIGRVLASKLKQLKMDAGRVGIIGIPQTRLNGQARTTGFLQALDEFGIKSADIRQQSDFSAQETYRFSMELISENPDLTAIWLQGSNRYGAALRAIKDAGKTGEILLVTFDAEPEFLDLIPDGVLVGAAMQQPYLMGQKAANRLVKYLQGAEVEKNIQLPVLAVSTDNITEQLPTIQRNVLGIETD